MDTVKDMPNFRLGDLAKVSRWLVRARTTNPIRWGTLGASLPSLSPVCLVIAQDPSRRLPDGGINIARLKEGTVNEKESHQLRVRVRDGDVQCS